MYCMKNNNSSTRSLSLEIRCLIRPHVKETGTSKCWSELGSQNRPFCLSIAFAKYPKMETLRHFLKFRFEKNIWIYWRLIFFFCTVQIKDSCIVDIENIEDFTCFSYVWSETSPIDRSKYERESYYPVSLPLSLSLHFSWKGRVPPQRANRPR